MNNEKNKKKWEHAEAEIIAIDTDDVIVTSGDVNPTPGTDPELPIEEF